MNPRTRNRREAPIAIIGGSGFIGSNLADNLLSDGEPVLVIDNLSRPGVEQNLEWLTRKHGRRLTVETIDVRDANALAPVLMGSKAIFHLAAQTAVTTSLVQPGEDFDINLRGTFNVLEAARLSGEHIPVIFASTNKVYGSLPDIAVREEGDRYVPCDSDIHANGIDETRGLDFCTPYGCSKGAADQYVLDYAKSYGMPTAVLRMSCIYGPRQFGTEDQGWVAHFLSAPFRMANHHLRRWPSGSRYPARLRCGCRLQGRARPDRDNQRPGLQSWRRTGKCAQPAHAVERDQQPGGSESFDPP